MNNLSKYILEKLHLNKETSKNDDESGSDIKKEVREQFKNEESIETLKFVLNFIHRSKPGPYSTSIFNYWNMFINKNVFSCMHIGWSRGGWDKVKYVEKVVDNYNKDHGTNIKSSISGWHADAGVSIMNIKEVVDALKEKFTDVKIDNDKELIEVCL